ncbi:MAG: DUF418 domain-containing protein, partial [Planctomycetota bacterium]|nr:DUF418 domain-containing protein [Planctomycetota bacterium]
VSVLAQMLLVAPLAGAAVIGAECALVVVLKWVLLARAAAGQHALWSCWCSRWDFLYVVWQFYALRALSALEGTLFLAWYLRAMGVRVGRRVVLGPGMAQVADPDMIIIEDDATVSANYQAHSFEDRVLKLAPTVVRRGATVGEAAVIFYGSDIGEEAWVTPASVVMKNERVAPGAIACGCPVQAYEHAAAVVDDAPHAAAEPATIVHGRSLALDVSRGLAVIGMIYMHLVPASESGDAAWTLPGFLSTLLEGKAAALFFVLAGIASELQARRSPAPSGVLVPLAVMMVLMRGLRSMHRTHLMAVGVALLAAAALLPVFFGAMIEADWTADGGHLADSTFGWATVRALCIDGNYPIVPWLVFPIIGTFMAASWGDEQARRGWLGASLLSIVLGLGLVVISRVDPEWSEVLAPYLASEWVPTTIPFVLISGGCAVAGISACAGWWRERRAGWIVREVALLGRSSLTHYLLHILVVYLPLKLVIGNDEWPAAVGVAAFAGYVAAAMVMSHVWFGKFRRGPVEAVWAVVSGASTTRP